MTNVNEKKESMAIMSFQNTKGGNVTIKIPIPEPIMNHLLYELYQVDAEGKINIIKNLMEFMQLDKCEERQIYSNFPGKEYNNLN